jgi:hypothetical protein
MSFDWQLLPGGTNLEGVPARWRPGDLPPIERMLPSRTSNETAPDYKAKPFVADL